MAKKHFPDAQLVLQGPVPESFRNQGPRTRTAKNRKKPQKTGCNRLLRRFCSRTFSVRLRPSPSVPVRSPPFYHILSYYSVLLCPLLSHPYPCSLSVISVSSFQPSTLGSDPFLVSSDLAFMLFLLLFGYNPYQPNPIVPRFLIIFCSYCLMIRSSLLFRYV